MEKTKVLFVSQEITPFLPSTEMSEIGRHLPQGIQEKGKEIRTFMPKYGCINERRNQLHEVIRLSGLNLVINESDHSLVIKVASIQSARMQVYFIDNDDYFSRKQALLDENEHPFDDNDERAIFFARGVLETVKKLRWSPDVVHCQGWFTGILPLFLKKAFCNDPLFSDTKVVFSIYDDEFSGSINADFASKLSIKGMSENDLKKLNASSYVALNKLAIDHSDAIIEGSPSINEELKEYVANSGKVFMPYQNQEKYISAYSELYDKLTAK